MLLPKFIITNKILSSIAKAEAAREVIENAPLVPAWEAKFRQEALLRTVHHGTHIEGNPLDINQAKEVLEGRDVAKAKDRDIQEIINYRNVLKFIDDRRSTIDNRQNLSEKDLLELHRLTTDKVLPIGESGKLRTTQVVVKNSKTGEISFTPPPAKAVEGQTKDFFEWLTSSNAEGLHPILKAGIAHYEIARIHPFVDGNGRTARSLATLILFKEGYDIKKFFSLEEYYDKNQKDYYAALQDASNQLITNESERDLTGWLEYFCTGLAVELERIKEKVRKLSIDIKLKGKVGQLSLSERQAKIIEYIQDYGQVTNKEWRNLLPDVSDDTILRDLKDLMKKKLVKKKGSTKSAVYVLR